jgi:hypothetical protein
MVVTGKVVKSGDSYSHILQKNCGQFVDVRTSGLAVGEYVTVSTDDRLAVAMGTVSNITQSTLTLLLNRQVLVLESLYLKQNCPIFRHVLCQKLRGLLAKQ